MQVYAINMQGNDFRYTSKESESYIWMSKYGSITIWLKSLHTTSSVFGPWHMRANYGAGETVKDEMFGTSPDVFWDVIKLQMMYPSAKMLSRSRSFRPLTTDGAHLEKMLCKSHRMNSVFAMRRTKCVRYGRCRATSGS